MWKLKITSTRFRSLMVAFWLFQSITLLGQEGWNFGPSYRMTIGKSSGPLQARMEGRKSLGSHAFVASVGGVSFAGIATPNEELLGKEISIVYTPVQPDGQRLLVIVENDSLFPFLPDWQLIPITKYADSEYHATISLFGPGGSPGFYDIVYHTAFNNTLIGMRLLQADIQLMDLNTFWELPTYEGKKILGIGETQENEDMARQAALEIQRALGNEYFQSWVLTDVDIPIEFFVKDNSLTLTGEPYYYFWYSTNVNPQGVQRRNEIVKEINMITDFIYTLRECDCLDKAQDYTLRRDSLMTVLEQNEAGVIEVDSLTQRMKQKTSALQRLNPNVFNSVTATMRYAAFFRYIKKTYPDKWITFLKKIETVEIMPSVKTPTRWRTPFRGY